MLRTASMLVLAACAAVGQYWGTDAFMPSNNGARGMAMGGCYVALADNHETFLKNPAGLGFLDHTEVSLGARSVVLGTIEDEAYREDSFDISEKYVPDVALRQVSLATDLPLQGKFSMGAGLAWGTLYDDNFGTEFSRTLGSTDITYRVASRGGFNVLTPAVGAAYDGKYAAGIALGWAVVSPSATRVEVDPRPEYWVDYSTTGTMGGTVALLGLQARPMERLYLGLNYMPGFTIDIEDREYEPDSGPSYDLDDITYEIPGQFTLGVAYGFGSSVVVAAEYGNRPLRHIRVNDEKLNLDDGHSLRVGVEIMTPVVLRVGYAADNYAQAAKPDKRKPALLHTVTAGLGIPIGPVTLDIGAEYAFTSHKYRDYYEDTYTQTENVLRIGADLSYVWQLFAKSQEE
jgi:hypothetical protein